MASAERQGSSAGVFATFLKLGLTSYGGPIAHIGYFRRELVERHRWVDETQFAQLLALCQFLPGPASSQLGFSLGLLDFLTEQTALVEAVFRLFLTNGNIPMTSQELGSRLNRPPETILRTLAGPRVYKGLRPSST